MAKLIVTAAGGEFEKLVPLTAETLTIGRKADNDLVIEDSLVSRHHARITRTGSSCVIEDAGSTNGIVVNGRRVPSAVLRDGDVIMIGNYRLVFDADVQREQVIEHLSELLPAGMMEPAPEAQQVHPARALARVIRKLEQLQDGPLDRAAAEEIIESLRNTAKTMSEQQKKVASLEKACRVMEAVAEIGKVVATILDVRRLLSFVLDTVLRLFGAERGFIMLYDQASDTFKPAISHNLADGEEATGEISMSVIRQVLDTRRAVHTSDASSDARFSLQNSVLLHQFKSVMCAPMMSRDHFIGVLYIDNSSAAGVFHQEDIDFLSAIAVQAGIALENARLYENVKEINLSTIRVLATALEAKDPYTRGHSRRVTDFTLAIARDMKLPGDELERLEYAALLHDIGKIGIPDDILRKPGGLTDPEYEEIKRHSEMGARIMAPASPLMDKLPYVKHHHERYDGTGYPDGLQGEEIPQGARIIAVADAFDAMTSKRSYRDALPAAEALRRLQSGAGSQFDPVIVERFVRIHETIMTGVEEPAPVF